MRTGSTARRLAALSLAAALLCVACGSDDDEVTTAPSTTIADGASTNDDASTDDTPTETDTGDDSSSSDGDALTPPDDLCTVVSADDVQAITQEAGVTAKQAPFGCTYSGEDIRASVYPTITVQENYDGAGGLDGARSGSESVLGAQGTDLDIDGNAGFVVVGSMMDSASTAATVEYRGLLITVNLSGESADIAEQLLALTVSKLG